jgi:putative DNA primase/helicase
LAKENGWDPGTDIRFRAKGLFDAIKKNASKGEKTSDLEQSLADLERSRPIVPRVPQLIRQDDTPEATAKSLAFEWPSAGIITAEAGIVFGGHAMNDDRLNTLWDGDKLSIGRVTSESFVVRGARITLGLMIQQNPLKQFLKRAGVLARGIGFLARCLICHPASTMGNRMYREPRGMPHPARHNARILRLLKTPLAFNDNDVLAPTSIDFLRPAQAAWIRYHDEIERDLNPSGAYFDAARSFILGSPAESVDDVSLGMAYPCLIIGCSQACNWVLGAPCAAGRLSGDNL